MAKIKIKEGSLTIEYYRNPHQKKPTATLILRDEPYPRGQDVAIETVRRIAGNDVVHQRKDIQA
jgi:hypothetical protein